MGTDKKIDEARITERATSVIQIEAEAVLKLAERLGPRFVALVKAVVNAKGRLITMGIGKSGIIAQKLAATFSSTGTPSYFVHPVEAAHGDLGIVGPDDVVFVISYSGETDEVVSVLPALRRRGAQVVAVTGNVESTLAENADYVIDASVDREACTTGLVPTASTTAALAMSDAVAVCVMELKGFREDDFALFHPGGEIGRRLQGEVRGIMHTGSSVPVVSRDAGLDEVVSVMSEKTFGITAVLNGRGKLAGVITDGDLRRLLESKKDLSVVRARDFCAADPKTIRPDETVARALRLMEKHQITALFVTDAEGRPSGIIHIHDILGRGRLSITG